MVAEPQDRRVVRIFLCLFFLLLAGLLGIHRTDGQRAHDPVFCGFFS
jgi:hypothetical protein